MAPNFTSSYSKDLNRKPECEREDEIESFYYLTSEGDLLMITEYALTGSEFHYYSKIVALGCTTEGFFADYSAQMRGLRFSDEHIVGELLELGMHDEEEDILIGRVAYNDFTFFDGSVMKTGKQIRGVAILDDYQAGGIARNVYKCLLMKHEYIVCDSWQTIGGGSLWASGMTSIGEVRIYDTIKKKFIDVLSNTGCGYKGIIPWSAEGLSQSDIAKWEPRKLSMDPCHHIVNIISKDRIYSND
ncbi:hypothetical protein [Moellerella wisconsensis]|uniref:Uncharacterized protein n=1 Tax=Moellerella wisconsensis TaxID=158849 RepID=A0A9Q8V480_9GAMM|nr:hypothetical protein [Moellerella wisconsensis]UNH31700.1 hypothetical protein MNY72_05225 [Moellerella wisconsensis]WJW82921.1 hypothetical protein QU516_05745 [Moellerella wisconsensis]